MLKLAKITRIITIISSILCYLVTAFFVMLRFYSMQFDKTNKMFVRGYYPYDISVSPNYELTMIGQCIAGSCSTTIYSCVDTFIAMLVLHACGQISNLKNELREIRLHEKTDVQAKLKKIVEKHNYVTRFVLKGNY
ncbi:hypothetical protein WN51_02658 [Melipona quadrifasciata]|uniref:Odorant receptor 13a n=1 Tax=Melipona quadrifasciata TaxID=166423 RepID=A0A0N0U439_9HYME|nr:hypothetical protein WN51_02658 [Melipona quadrifasciata]